MNRILLCILYAVWMRYSMVVSQDPIGLRVGASLRGFLMGAGIEAYMVKKPLDQGNYTANLFKNYQVVVAENDFKAVRLWWGDNIYNFTEPDWLLGGTPSSTGWIQEQGLQLRAVNLLWAHDAHIPEWLLHQEASITSDKAKSLLSDYIHTVVGRYRGKIPWWDVINEAIEDVPNNTRPFNLRNSFWFRKLGPDFLKYAFIFAREADPDVKLYYNDYYLEMLGYKSNITFELVNWLRSEGATIDGIGCEWHIDVSRNVTPGDQFYQTAQRFVDQGLNFTVTELDVSIAMKDGQPVNPADLDKQGLLYRDILRFVLHFASHSPILLTWGFTDRYSWIPGYSNFTKGDALPFDRNYQLKPAYLQMQEELARVLLDGIYRLSPKSQPNQCLGASSDTTSSAVQLYSDGCDQTNEIWNITWLADGTYRLSPVNINSRALAAYNTTATVGVVQTSEWTGNYTEEWVFASKENNTFRVGPRNAWIRVLSVSGATDIGIVDYDAMSGDQSWIATAA